MLQPSKLQPGVLQGPRRSLWDLTAPEQARPDRFLADHHDRIAVRDLASGSSLDAARQTCRGRSVLIATSRQLPAALAATELDGIARRLVLCTPDLSAEHLACAIADAAIDTIVSDDSVMASQAAPHARLIRSSTHLRAHTEPADRTIETEWVLFTSGTTGRPKLALHTLSALTGPIHDGIATSEAVWSSFYDTRRYGGLQILLRALGGGGSMVFSDAEEPVAEFLARAGSESVTHMSGTPSHWRRALISDAANRMSPSYVRLSGEACDQAILDRLRKAYPDANIAHAFASTEAGVAFDVRDGRAGFPAGLIDQPDQAIEMHIEDGSLRIRSQRNATRYLGAETPDLADRSGFVDTGDMLERRGDRYFFVGRRGGIINVGGLKVHPEAVEAVINQHPAVHSSRISPRRSPITGAIVVGEIVVNATGPATGAPFAAIKAEILDLCRGRLAPHEVPALLRQVPSLEIAASGKLVRHHA